MKYCIDQPGSLGDILFSIKIAEELAKKGEVYWYIAPCFWESGVSRIKVSDNVHLGPDVPRYVSGAETIKLTDLTERHDPDLMIKKYEVAGVDWEDWVDYLKYDRDLETEKELKEFLGIEDGDRYILMNQIYGTNQIHLGVKRDLPKDYPGKIIEMQVFNESTIFDWCGIFENAEEIHTVDTSIQYVIESLDISAKLVVHPRHYNTPPIVSKLFKKPWEWINHDRDTWRKLAPQEAE